MGAIIDELDDHEGYALGRLADGTLTAALTHGVEFTAYVAGCGCGWHSRHQHPPTEDGEEAAYQQWEREHAVVELARQATRRRQDLARVLAWLGGQAGRLEDPAAVERVAGGLDRAHRLVTALQHDPRAASVRAGDRPVSDERPLSAWSDRRMAEHGRVICQQRSLPTDPGLAGEQAAVLEQWARRWRQRGPHDLPGHELGLIEELAAELRRIAVGLIREPHPEREVDGAR